MPSRTVNLCLLDGDVNGVLKITCDPWNGVLFRIPRNLLYQCTTRNEMQYSSIYFLIGPSEHPSVPAVYVGQAGPRGIMTRLIEHNKHPNKSFWTEAFILTTSGSNKGFASHELDYLEHAFYKLATGSGQCVVRNSVVPSSGNIREEFEGGLIETVEMTNNILNLLGCRIFNNSFAPCAPEIPPLFLPPTNEMPSISSSCCKQQKKIGQFVQEDLVVLMNSGRIPPTELDKLTSLTYCKEIIKKKTWTPILKHWPRDVREEDIAFVGGMRRYYSQIKIECNNKRYLLCSQWYREQYDDLLAWCDRFQ